MKIFNFKSLILGAVIGAIIVTAIFATRNINSPKFTQSKIYFYGEEVPLKNSLVSVAKDNNTDPQLYMPMKEFLEYMHFNVDRNDSDDSVNLTMKGYDGSIYTIADAVQQKKATYTEDDFSHGTRISLGCTKEAVSYRNGDADQVETQSDGSTVWIYEILGRVYKVLPSGGLSVDIPGNRSVYYFSSSNDGELYATQFSIEHGETFNQLINRLGEPDKITDIDTDLKCIFYALEEPNRYAYYYFSCDKAILTGIMYSTDVSILTY